jgi:hypothetical protein
MKGRWRRRKEAGCLDPLCCVAPRKRASNGNDRWALSRVANWACPRRDTPWPRSVSTHVFAATVRHCRCRRGQQAVRTHPETRVDGLGNETGPPPARRLRCRPSWRGRARRKSTAKVATTCSSATACGWRSRRRVHERDSQIIMQSFVWRSSLVSAESQWSGWPARTRVSRMPSLQEDNIPTPASSTSDRIDLSGGIVRVSSLRWRITSNAPDSAGLGQRLRAEPFDV